MKYLTLIYWIGVFINALIVTIAFIKSEKVKGDVLIYLGLICLSFFSVMSIIPIVMAFYDVFIKGGKDEV